MEKRTFKKNILHSIIKVFLIINGLNFMGYGCGNSVSPEKEGSYYNGILELTYANRPDSSSLIHNQRLTLYTNKSFECTSSFFWSKDSTATHPLKGTWSISDSYWSSHHTGHYINFKVDSAMKSWDLQGSKKDGYLRLYPEYEWKYIQ